MKVLGIVGSPRREKGRTDALVQSALSGAKIRKPRFMPIRLTNWHEKLMVIRYRHSEK